MVRHGRGSRDLRPHLRQIHGARRNPATPRHAALPTWSKFSIGNGFRGHNHLLLRFIGKRSNRQGDVHIGLDWYQDKMKILNIVPA